MIAPLTALLTRTGASLGPARAQMIDGTPYLVDGSGRVQLVRRGEAARVPGGRCLAWDVLTPEELSACAAYGVRP